MILSVFMLLLATPSAPAGESVCIVYRCKYRDDNHEWEEDTTVPTGNCRCARAENMARWDELQEATPSILAQTNTQVSSSVEKARQDLQKELIERDQKLLEQLAKQQEANAAALELLRKHLETCPAIPAVTADPAPATDKNP